MAVQERGHRFMSLRLARGVGARHIRFKRYAALVGFLPVAPRLPLSLPSGFLPATLNGGWPYCGSCRNQAWRSRSLLGSRRWSAGFGVVSEQATGFGIRAVLM